MADEVSTVAPEGGAPVATPVDSPAPSQQSVKPTPGSGAAPAPQVQTQVVPPETPAHQDYQPVDDSEKFLLGPTHRPNEPITSGISPRGTLMPPKNIKVWLPQLDAAAQVPGAPPQLRLLVQLLMHHMDNA